MRETYEQMRERAREIAAEAPPFTAEQISRLRMLLGVDRATAVPHMETAGVPAPAAATAPTPTTEAHDHDIPGDQSNAA